MIDFSPEIETLRAAGAVDDATAARLLAQQRRDVFSVHPELRLASWLGVMLVVTGAGILVTRNLDRIGPATLAVAIALAAAACYGYAVWRRRAGHTSFLDEFVLLLGALLLSVDLGYIESQFHVLDHGWPRHFLIAAILHGTGAYFFGSRALLALSLVALAAWLGVEQRFQRVFESSLETSVRALLSSVIVLIWRAIDRRQRASRAFQPVFEHFAANLALFGALSLTFEGGTRILGSILTLVFAAVVVAHGFRRRTEAFVIYAYVYGVIAIDVLMVEIIGVDVFIALYLIVSTIAAIVGLFLLHLRFRRSA